MKAIVISVKKEKLQGKWDGYMFVYKGEAFQGREKEPTERFVFGNQPIAKEVASLTPGMWVDLTFVKEGKHTNLTGLRVIDSPAPAAEAPKAAPGTPAPYRRDEAEIQRRISRSAALKEATQIALHQAKATTKPEVIVEMAKEITRELERFLNFEEEEKKVTSAVGTVTTSEDFEQPPFDM